MSCRHEELFASAPKGPVLIHETDDVRSGLALLGVGSSKGTAAYSFVQRAPDRVMRLIMQFAAGEVAKWIVWALACLLFLPS